MIITCPSCTRRYRLDPARLGGRTVATVRCPACGATSTVSTAGAAETIPGAEAEADIAATAPGAPAPTPPPETPPGDRTTRLAADAGLLPAPAHVAAGELALPEGVRVTLAVLEGKDSGRMFRVEHPSVVIGRGEGDIRLDDTEVSRRHARLTVHGTRVVLHDLGSTNGTFVDERKISEEAIENRAEFRVGATRLMLILSEDAGDGTGGGI